MGGQFGILLNQMFIFFTLIALGFLAQRLKLLNSAAIDGLSLCIVKLILPCMIFTSVVNSATIDGVLQKIPLFFCAILMLFILISFGIISSFLIRLKAPTKYINISLVGFPNTGFIGYPLITAMFPHTGALSLVVYSVVEQILFWSIVPMLTKKEFSIKNIDFRGMINPSFISLMLGLLLVVINIHPKNVFFSTLTSVGDTSKFLALIYIGADIGRRGFKTLVKNPKVFLMAPIKLIVVPLVVFFVVRMLGVLSNDELIVLSTLAMLPPMVIVSIMAAQSDSDAEYATAGIIVTTLLSMVTMPIVMKIMVTLL